MMSTMSDIHKLPIRSHNFGREGEGYQTVNYRNYQRSPRQRNECYNAMFLESANADSFEYLKRDFNYRTRVSNMHAFDLSRYGDHVPRGDDKTEESAFDRYRCKDQMQKNEALNKELDDFNKFVDHKKICSQTELRFCQERMSKRNEQSELHVSDYCTPLDDYKHLEIQDDLVRSNLSAQLEYHAQIKEYEENRESIIKEDGERHRRVTDSFPDGINKKSIHGNDNEQQNECSGVDDYVGYKSVCKERDALAQLNKKNESRIKELEQQIKEEKEAKETLVTSTHEEKKALKRKLKDCIAYHKEYRDKASNKNKILISKLSEKKKELSEISDKHKKLEGMCTNLKEKLRKCLMQYSKAVTEKNQIISDHELVKASDITAVENEHLKKKLAISEDDMRRLKASYDQLMNDYKTAEHALQDSQSLHESELKRLQQIIDSLQDEKKRSMLSGINSACLKRKIASLEEQLHTANDSLAKCRSEHELELNDVKLDCKNRIKNVELKLQSNEEFLQTKAKYIYTLQNELNQCKKELSVKEHDSAGFKEQKENFVGEEKVKELEKHIESLENQKTGMNSVLEQFKIESDELKSKMNVITVENERLKNECQQNEENGRLLNRKIEELQKQNEDLRKSVTTDSNVFEEKTVQDIEGAKSVFEKQSPGACEKDENCLASGNEEKKNGEMGQQNKPVELKKNVKAVHENSGGEFDDDFKNDDILGGNSKASDKSKKSVISSEKVEVTSEKSEVPSGNPEVQTGNLKVQTEKQSFKEEAAKSVMDDACATDYDDDFEDDPSVKSVSAKSQVSLHTPSSQVVPGNAVKDAEYESDFEDDVDASKASTTRSEKSQTSHRSGNSDASHRSGNSGASCRSGKSDPSHGSRKSDASDRSGKSNEPGRKASLDADEDQDERSCEYYESMEESIASLDSDEESEDEGADGDGGGFFFAKKKKSTS